MKKESEKLLFLYLDRIGTALIEANRLKRIEIMEKHDGVNLSPEDYRRIWDDIGLSI